MSCSALVIEDDVSAQEILKRMLDIEGFVTTTKSQGDTALQYLTDHQPDVVLLDMNLPVVQGDQILKYIRAEEHLKKTIVIIVSAYDLHPHSEDEANYVVAKPVKPSEFIVLLRQLNSPDSYRGDLIN